MKTIKNTEINNPVANMDFEDEIQSLIAMQKKITFFFNTVTRSAAVVTVVGILSILFL